MDAQLFSELRAIRDQQTANHTEVVQRLTALETNQAPIADLEKRVKKLEGWRNMIAGGLVAIGFLLKSVIAYLSNRH